LLGNVRVNGAGDGRVYEVGDGRVYDLSFSWRFGLPLQAGCKTYQYYY